MNKPYFSTSTKENYETLDEAIAHSIVFNSDHNIASSEIIFEEDGELVRGQLNRVGSSRI